MSGGPPRWAVVEPVLRTLLTLASLASLAVPLSAGLDPLPALPYPVDWVPSDATGVAVGAGTLVQDQCQEEFALALVLFNQTASRGQWSGDFLINANHVGMLTPADCKVSGQSPNIIPGDFDPATGGCFVGVSPATTVCLTFVSADAQTGVRTYDVVYDWSLWEPLTFRGSVDVAFSDPLPPWQ